MSNERSYIAAFVVGFAFLLNACSGFDDDGASVAAPMMRPDTTIALTSLPGAFTLIEGKSVGVLNANATFAFLEILDSNYVKNDGMWSRNFRILIEVYCATDRKTMELNTYADPRESIIGIGPRYSAKLMNVQRVGKSYQATILIDELSVGRGEWL